MLLGGAASSWVHGATAAAKPPPTHSPNARINQVEEEVERYGDIIFVREKTDYKSILYKTFYVRPGGACARSWACAWGSCGCCCQCETALGVASHNTTTTTGIAAIWSFLPQVLEYAAMHYDAAFVLKTDDDAFVNVGPLMQQLRAVCEDPECRGERIYMGRVAHRSEVVLQPGHRWNNADFYIHTGGWWCVCGWVWAHVEHLLGAPRRKGFAECCAGGAALSVCAGSRLQGAWQLQPGCAADTPPAASHPTAADAARLALLLLLPTPSAGLRLYPNYMMGGGYVIGGEVARVLVDMHARTPLRFTTIEDATVGFWLAPLEVRHIDHPKFYTWAEPCCFNTRWVLLGGRVGA